MSAAILPALPAADSLRRKRFTRSEVDRMQDHGFFDEQRCEFIDGELIDVTGMTPAHAYAIRETWAYLAKAFDLRRVRIRCPFEAASEDRDRNLPEPDLAIVAQDREEYGKRHPRGDELLLIVEVADSSLRQDLMTKRTLYARASVPEYWVLDVSLRRLIVHRNPVNGDYTSTLLVTEHESIACLSRSDSPVAVRDLLS